MKQIWVRTSIDADKWNLGTAYLELPILIRRLDRKNGSSIAAGHVMVNV